MLNCCFHWNSDVSKGRKLLCAWERFFITKVGTKLAECRKKAKRDPLDFKSVKMLQTFLKYRRLDSFVNFEFLWQQFALQFCPHKASEPNQILNYWTGELLKLAIGMDRLKTSIDWKKRFQFHTTPIWNKISHKLFGRIVLFLGNSRKTSILLLGTLLLSRLPTNLYSSNQSYQMIL